MMNIYKIEPPSINSFVLGKLFREVFVSRTCYDYLIYQIEFHPHRRYGSFVFYKTDPLMNETGPSKKMFFITITYILGAVRAFLSMSRCLNVLVMNEKSRKGSKLKNLPKF